MAMISVSSVLRLTAEPEVDPNPEEVNAKPEAETDPEPEMLQWEFWVESILPMLVIVLAFMIGPIVLCVVRGRKIRDMRKKKAALARAKNKIKFMMTGGDFKQTASPEGQKKNATKTLLNQCQVLPPNELEAGSEGFNNSEPVTPSSVSLESESEMRVKSFCENGQRGKAISLLERVKQLGKEQQQGTILKVQHGDPTEENEKQAKKPLSMLEQNKQLKKDESDKSTTGSEANKDESTSDNAPMITKPLTMLQRVKLLKEKEDAKPKQSENAAAATTDSNDVYNKLRDSQGNPLGIPPTGSEKLGPPVPKCADYSPLYRLMQQVKDEDDKKCNNIGQMAAPHIDAATDTFLNEYDRSTILSLGPTLHGWRPFLQVAGPCLASLALCPLTLYLYQPLVNVFWWDVQPGLVTLPNVNEAILCFLMPAGVVYATSFGFAIDTAVAKQTSIMKKLCKEIGMLDQITSLTSKLVHATVEQKCILYTIVKNEAINLIQDIKNQKLRFEYKESCWFILNMLRNMKRQDGSFNLDIITADKIIILLSKTKDNIGKKTYMHGRIHIMQWLFLELLGFITFFGILLTQTQTYQGDLLFCMLTVFSISLLCYVVSDLDSPFSGFFRIDVGVVIDVIDRAEEMFVRVREGRAAELYGYPKHTGKWRGRAERA